MTQAKSKFMLVRAQKAPSFLKATLTNQLEEEVAMYRGQAFSADTKKTYQTHLRSYIAFCDPLNILPVPVSDVAVAKYAAYVARRLKPSSVKQFLNIIRTVH